MEDVRVVSSWISRQAAASGVGSWVREMEPDIGARWFLSWIDTVSVGRTYWDVFGGIDHGGVRVRLVVMSGHMQPGILKIMSSCHDGGVGEMLGFGSKKGAQGL